MDSAKDLVDRQYEMIRQRDVVGLPDLYAHDAFYAMPGMMVRPVELPALMRAWFAAFPDMETEVTGWITVVESVITATVPGLLLLLDAWTDVPDLLAVAVAAAAVVLFVVIGRRTAAPVAAA